MTTTRGLLDLVTRLQRESESVCVRGVRAASAEQLNWFRNSRDRLAEMGAGFLSQKITFLLDAIESDDKAAAAQLLDLLTTIRVFERVVTLGEVKAQLTTIRANQSAVAGDDE